MEGKHMTHPLRPPGILAITTALVLALAACGGSDSSKNAATSPPGTASSSESPSTLAASDTAVTIDNFAFLPETVTITVGSAATWTNQQGVAHTVTADDGSFDSGDLASNATFDRTFDTAGTFSYHCSIHATMTGTVIVEP